MLCIIFGQKGLIKYFSLQQKIFDQSLTKQELINEINLKKTKVEGMNSESLDLDLLDEEARKNLGYSSKNEIIIYQENKQHKKTNDPK